MSIRSSDGSQSQSTQVQAAASRVVRQTPRETSTVVPGQLPIVTRAPVRALNRVDLPELGAPARETTGASGPAEAKDPPAWQVDFMAGGRAGVITRLRGFSVIPTPPR